MTVSFDPAKDAINRAKHGLSLARADEVNLGRPWFVWMTGTITASLDGVPRYD